ncbi:TMEM43 family protein [Lysobacter sp. CCNWLW3]|uniref:TMEM43 family protein n=1 Tax=unclassified Lysobacter TaxID=2635362 RepID=UPI002FD34E5F
MRSARAALLLPIALFVAAAAAQAPAPPGGKATTASTAEPVGEPTTAGILRDREFGVSSRRFGLDRRVEMYQWRATPTGYERVWNAAPIDSQGYAPGHQNPPTLPLENRRWWSESASLDGRPIDSGVLHALGEWRVFRPNFSRLPANLAATFQPEGDGLGSAENPLDPQIGDLRVSWRELQLPPLEGKVELVDGRWRMSAATAAAALNAAPVPAPVAAPEAEGAHRLWPWFGGAALVIAIALVARRRRRAKAKATSE